MAQLSNKRNIKCGFCHGHLDELDDITSDARLLNVMIFDKYNTFTKLVDPNTHTLCFVHHDCISKNEHVFPNKKNEIETCVLPMGQEGGLKMEFQIVPNETTLPPFSEKQKKKKEKKIKKNKK